VDVAVDRLAEDLPGGGQDGAGQQQGRAQPGQGVEDVIQWEFLVICHTNLNNVKVMLEMFA
jgi:hypothetical protein